MVHERVPRAGATNKTQPTDASVPGFLASVEPERRRRDAYGVCALLARVTATEPVLWGPSIVGFGSYDYAYPSGRHGSAPRIGFSPRKAQTVLYVPSGFDGLEALLDRLGPHALGKSCLYLKDVAAVDAGVLEEVTRRTWAQMAARYPECVPGSPGRPVSARRAGGTAR